VEFKGSGYQLGYPSNWTTYPVNQGAAVTIAPADGVIKQQNGQPALAIGMMAGYFEPKNSNLRAATNQMISELQSSNPDLKPLRGKSGSISVHGKTGQSVQLEGPATGPAAGQGRRESVWLVTTQHPSGFFYLIFVSPETRTNELRPVYEKMVQSVRLN
jgi:hypothetical protein